MTNSPEHKTPSTFDTDSSPRPPRDPNRKGWLIAFEGIDGAGKSVQVRAITEWLVSMERPVCLLFEPTKGPVGMKIRKLFASGRESVAPEEEFRLFLEDRKWNVDTNIRPALDRGEIVLLDRYYLSSIAYQGALGLDPMMIRRENEAIAPVPDRVYLLDLPAANAHARIRESRGDEPNLFERSEYLRRVAQGFNRLRMPCILRIDALLSPDAITHVIKQDLIRLLNLAAT